MLSPMAQDVLELVQTRGTDAASVWESLDKIPQAHDLWDDIVNVAVQLRLNRQWEPIITVSLSPNRTAAPHTLAACLTLKLARAKILSVWLWVFDLICL